MEGGHKQENAAVYSAVLNWSVHSGKVPFRMFVDQVVAKYDERLVSYADKGPRQWFEEGNGSFCNVNQRKRPMRSMKKRKRNDTGLIRPGRRLG